MAVELQEDCVGITLRVTLYQPGTTEAQSLSGVTTVNFRLKPPAGDVVERVGTVEDANAGIVTYTTVSGDLTAPGGWKLQVHLAFNDGKVLTSRVTKFKVKANI